MKVDLQLIGRPSSSLCHLPILVFPAEHVPRAMLIVCRRNLAAAVGRRPIMRKTKRRKTTRAKTKLGLPDLEQAKSAVLASSRSPESQRSYQHSLTLDHLQRREEHWAIVDLVGKGGHIRTIPVPDWVKQTIDDWLTAPRVTSRTFSTDNFRLKSSAASAVRPIGCQSSARFARPRRSHRRWQRPVPATVSPPTEPVSSTQECLQR